MPPISEQAPKEIATLARAFNQMSEGLAQMDAERTVMLAGVSHDLRTPLAKMRLAIEMLTADGEPTLIESLLRSATEMDAIIDQFLEFARDARVDDKHCVDLNRLVRKCARGDNCAGIGGAGIGLAIVERIARLHGGVRACGDMLPVRVSPHW